MDAAQVLLQDEKLGGELEQFLGGDEPAELVAQVWVLVESVEDVMEGVDGGCHGDCSSSLGVVFSISVELQICRMM